MTSSRRINDRMSSCVGKETYDSYDSAYRAKGRCDKRGKPSRVFRCDHCHKWHLATNQRKPKNFEGVEVFEKGSYIPSLGIRIR